MGVPSKATYGLVFTDWQTGMSHHRPLVTPDNQPDQSTLDRIKALQNERDAVDSEITYRIVVGRPCSARPQFATMTTAGLESEMHRITQTINKLLHPYEKGGAAS